MDLQVPRRLRPIQEVLCTSFYRREHEVKRDQVTCPRPPASKQPLSPALSAQEPVYLAIVYQRESLPLSCRKEKKLLSWGAYPQVEEKGQKHERREDFSDQVHREDCGGAGRVRLAERGGLHQERLPLWLLSNYSPFAKAALEAMDQNAENRNRGRALRV